MDRDVLLEALGVICNATVTSVQKQRTQESPVSDTLGGAAQQLSTRTLFSSVLCGDRTCTVARSNLRRISSAIAGSMDLMGGFLTDFVEEQKLESILMIDEEEFFHPRYDYDFTGLKDTETFYRGGEEYKRPCGWRRFALKVLDKYGDNTWLGTTSRTTESVSGEWPVSYHGTSEKGAEGIIEGHYKPGPGEWYGRGVYSTPDLSVAIGYAKRFYSKKAKKWYKVILQNRINPVYREEYGNYWLVPIEARANSEKEEQEEQEEVERAIRPYGLLLRED